MTPANPFAAINLSGDSLMRGATFALPVDRVRNLLPTGLDLGPQDVTPQGTHPVILLFNDIYRAHFSIPTLVPNMTYHEHTVGVPYCYLTTGSITPGHPGPYYYMPKLYLDNFSAIIGGLAFWGFNKEMASFEVTGNSYTITSSAGQRLASLSVDKGNFPDFSAITTFPLFEPVRQMLLQPLISMVPAAIGPFFVLADFDKTWDEGMIRPVNTVAEIAVEFIPGYPAGAYPAAGIDASVLGSYELRVPWRLSLPYPPILNFR